MYGNGQWINELLSGVIQRMINVIKLPSLIIHIYVQ